MNIRFLHSVSPLTLGGLSFLLGLLVLGTASACSEERPSSARLGDDSVGGPVSLCVDQDGDGFGVGCDTGRDCDDSDPAIAGGCPLADCTQTPTAPGCDCSGQGAMLDCGEVHQQVGDGVICGYGTQTCDEGKWSGCRINALPGRLRQALSAPAACPTNPCDPYCKEFLDAPNVTGTVTSAIACAIAPSCQDGLMNQDEAGIDCEGSCPKACAASGAIFSTTFTTSAEGFSYSDDEFRNTNAGGSATGSLLGGELAVTLGLVPLSGPTSGAFVQNFTSNVPVDVTFDWSLSLPGAFLSDECGEILGSVDDVLYGLASNDFVAKQCGPGSSSGSFTFTTNPLSAGNHLLALGAYLNKNVGSASVTRLEVEDYTLYNNPTADGNDGGRGGDTGFEISSEGTLSMGWTDPGDYVEWDFTAPVDGTYSVNYRIASGGSGTWGLNLTRNGSSASSTSGGPTGGYQNWQTATGNSFFMSAGVNQLRITVTGSGTGLNVNYIEVIEPNTGPTASFSIDNVVVTSPNGAICGDATCDSGTESCVSCPSDCGDCTIDHYCGDATCDADENSNNCESDCGVALVDCGNGVCDADESCESCRTDCGTCPPAPTCGDAICNGAEDCTSCEKDCGICTIVPGACGDGTCDPGEDCDGCAIDCGACGPIDTSPRCGDNTCNTNENEGCDNCAVDCGACADLAVCGDAICSTGEDCSTCATDCTSCGTPPRCGDGSCNGSEDCGTCAMDCNECGPAACNNGICETDEDCNSCAADCGSCIALCPVADPPEDLCGNATCDATAGEDCLTCEGDCGACSFPSSCGDGTCNINAGEDCDSCETDCGACQCGNSVCEPSIGESCLSCETDCGACSPTQITTCGDSVCELGENCDTCPSDCNACPFLGTGAPFNGGIVVKGTVKLNNSTTVNGDIIADFVDTGLDSVINGSIEANVDVRVGDRTRISGVVRAGRDVLLGSNTVTGTVEEPVSVAVPIVPVITANPGTIDIVTGPDATLIVTPGRYRDVNLESRNTITFTAGRYDFRSMKFNTNSTFIIDSTDGPIEWRIQNDLIIQSNTSFTFPQGDPLQWGVFCAGNITVFPDVTFPSSLYAPNGYVQIESRGDVTGGIAADELRFKPNVTLNTGIINTGWSTPEPPPVIPAPVCGDLDCTPETGEECLSCAVDCGSCGAIPGCGDAAGVCDTNYGESCSSCEADCGGCATAGVCPDSACDASLGENCSNCEADCGECVAPVVCGDGLCVAGENCGTCALDCGVCPAFETNEFTDLFEITDACNDDQEPLWAGLSWTSTTPGDSKVNIFFRSAATEADLATAPEVLVGVAAATAAFGGFRYGPPEERAAMERGFQYLDDMNVAEKLPRHGYFGQLRFQIFATSDGSQAATLESVSLQSSCETVQ